MTGWHAGTLIGLSDGNDVPGFIPVNPADNILHLVLSAVAILSALASRGLDHDRDEGGVHRAPATTGTVTERRVVETDRNGARFDREQVAPRDLNRRDRA